MTPTALQSLQPIDIFNLLGYTGSDEQQKNQILAEAQELLIQDLVEVDLAGKISEPDMQQASQIMSDESKSSDQRQADLLTFLHDKVPNLEQLLIEKTAQMKLDVMQERLNDMKQEFAEDALTSQQLAQAELHLQREQYAKAAQIMNQAAARVPKV